VNTALNDVLTPCHDCGETGRVKAAITSGRDRTVYCHDEEKSCYNYVLMRVAA